MNLYHSPDHFRASDDTRALARPAEATEPTQEMIAVLVKHVREQFYTTWPERRWLQEQGLILKWVTWPASWLNERGISLSLARYEAILREIIVGIQRHGDTGKIKFFPVYFGHTIKQWFIHNGESLYEERKAIRNSIDLRFLKGLPPTQVSGPDPIAALAMAHRVLATRRVKTKAPKIDESQPSLFDV